MRLSGRQSQFPPLILFVPEAQRIPKIYSMCNMWIHTSFFYLIFLIFLFHLFLFDFAHFTPQ